MKESKALWILSTYGLVGSDLGVKMKYGYGELDWWKLKEKEILVSFFFVRLSTWFDYSIISIVMCKMKFNVRLWMVNLINILYAVLYFYFFLFLF